MRTVSVGWLNRIAAALGVTAADLVSLPDRVDVTVAAVLGPDGAAAPKRATALLPPMPEGEMVGMLVETAQGEYRGGDSVWLTRLEPKAFATALNRDILVPRPGRALRLRPAGRRRRQEAPAPPPRTRRTPAGHRRRGVDRRGQGADAGAVAGAAREPGTVAAVSQYAVKVGWPSKQDHVMTPNRRFLSAVTAVALLAVAAPAAAAPVLMISIDGLRPLDVLDADRGFDAPNLRRLMTEGSYATGVRNSLPTVTYPNHTTLITGVWPAKHGIAGNATFDPLGKNAGGWYWYASDIKVPTLWDAVHAAGGKVASIGWPVSVGAASIDYDFPEYWRARIPEDLKLVRALATPGLPAAVEAQSGVATAAMFGEEAPADDAKAAIAAAIYALDKPAFFTVHLSSLDHNEHSFAPGSPEAKATLARVDAAVGRLVAAARAAEPGIDIVVVSDHGFAPPGAQRRPRTGVHRGRADDARSRHPQDHGVGGGAVGRRLGGDRPRRSRRRRGPGEDAGIARPARCRPRARHQPRRRRRRGRADGRDAAGELLGRLQARLCQRPRRHRDGRQSPGRPVRQQGHPRLFPRPS